jgi:putative oxidoreductase
MHNTNDAAILLARLFLTALFLTFGWRKLTDYSGTVDQMVRDHAPAPGLAAAIAVFVELPLAFAVAIGAFTRPLAITFVLYTLGTSLMEHRYWAMKKGDRLDSMEAFFKNLSIMGGFLLLYVTGAGRYSIDALLNLPAR